ncbi:hypothetical protein BRADI_4g20563v3 [Brachypodium distachyon]|uniref:Uncharacterized protein n=1 Tax=Brachypodium distachyon TaxID=15368 RepID=A0A2K2CNZ2_BRADI|nr:hypothetical protein BRADI_4g20563v3 [Brachypodium distachyon]
MPTALNTDRGPVLSCPRRRVSPTACDREPSKKKTSLSSIRRRCPYHMQLRARDQSQCMHREVINCFAFAASSNHCMHASIYG